jgi:hypothetical protein
VALAEGLASAGVVLLLVFMAYNIAHQTMFARILKASIFAFIIDILAFKVYRYASEIEIPAR